MVEIQCMYEVEKSRKNSLKMTSYRNKKVNRKKQSKFSDSNEIELCPPP